MSFEIREMFIDELGFEFGFEIEHILWSDNNPNVVLSEQFNDSNVSCGIIVFEKEIR